MELPPRRGREVSEFYFVINAYIVAESPAHLHDTREN